MANFLDQSEQVALKQLQAWRSWLAMTAIWGTIILAASAAIITRHPLVFLLAVILIGSRQFALAVLMHEAAHGVFFANRRFNDAIGQWLCAFPIMLDINPYRTYHSKHHSYTETEQDPDIVLSRGWPVSRLSFSRKILRDLTGIAGVRRYASYFRAAAGDPSQPFHRRLLHLIGTLRGFFVTNLLLLLLFSVFAQWYWYVLLWWLPLLTWYSLIYRLRNIAEHALVPAASDFSVARTTMDSRLYRWLWAPLNVNYHGEHHLLPSCPWYRLPQMHRLLKEKGLIEQMCLAPGYASVWRQVVHTGAVA